MFPKLKAWVSRNYLLIIGQIVAALVCVWVYGCESKVTALNGSGTHLTRDQLDVELRTILATAKIKFEQLDKQDAFKRIIFNNAVIHGSGGTVNPIGVITALFALTGLAATADDIRLRKERKKLIEYQPNDTDHT